MLQLSADWRVRRRTHANNVAAKKLILQAFSRSLAVTCEHVRTRVRRSLSPPVSPSVTGRRAAPPPWPVQTGGYGLGFRRWILVRLAWAGRYRGHIMANRKDRRKSAAVRRSSGTMSAKEKRQLIIGALIVGGVVVAVLAIFMWPR